MNLAKFRFFFCNVRIFWYLWSQRRGAFNFDRTILLPPLLYFSLCIEILSPWESGPCVELWQWLAPRPTDSTVARQCGFELRWLGWGYSMLSNASVITRVCLALTHPTAPVWIDMSKTEMWIFSRNSCRISSLSLWLTRPSICRVGIFFCRSMFCSISSVDVQYENTRLLWLNQVRNTEASSWSESLPFARAVNVFDYRGQFCRQLAWGFLDAGICRTYRVQFPVFWSWWIRGRFRSPFSAHG